MGNNRKPTARRSKQPRARRVNVPAPESDDPSEAAGSWWQRQSKRVRSKFAAFAGVIITAAAVALVTAVVNQTVAEREQKPGGMLTADVEVIPKCGQVYALPETIDPDTQAAELLAVSNHNDMLGLIRERRGAPIGTITVEIAFTGKSQRPTRIMDVKVANLKTTPNLAGTALHTYCGGDPPTRVVELDLDKPPRDLMSDSQPYFDLHDLDVTIEERETLRVFVSANKNSYRWVFAIRYLDTSGSSITRYLDAYGHLHSDPDQVPEGAEFSLTGAAHSYGAEYEESGGQFYLRTE